MKIIRYFSATPNVKKQSLGFERILYDEKDIDFSKFNILISDWSGITAEYVMIHKKPFLINTYINIIKFSILVTTLLMKIL